MTVGYLVNEDGLTLETREMISLLVVMAAIVLWNVINVWLISSHTSRLIQEIRALGTGTSDVEREQGHQERTP